MRLSERWYLPVFLVLAGTLMVLALTGALDALASAVDVMAFGDAATWFAGIATAAVALLAWRTARDAAKVSAYTLQEQVKAEASGVTWWFETHVLPAVPGDADLADLPPPAGILPWELEPPVQGEGSGTAVLLIRNGNSSPVGNVLVHIVDERYVHSVSLGTHSIGLLRPGVVRFRVNLRDAGTSAKGESIVLTRLAENGFAEWLEFTDSANRTWRRHADGSLHLRDIRSVGSRSWPQVQ
jgi:hypothetical protein